jgi:hypothetical protein
MSQGPGEDSTAGQPEGGGPSMGDPNDPTIDPAEDDPDREGEDRFDAG